MKQIATMEKNPGNSVAAITICYTFALTLIALLSIGGFLMLRSIIQNTSASSTVINVSGRQRRLSTLIAFDTLQLRMPSQDVTVREDYRQDLLQSIALMQRSHDALTGKTNDLDLPKYDSEAIKNIYYSAPAYLDDSVRKYLQKATEIAQSNESQLSQQSQNLNYVISVGSNDLVKKLDVAVQQYETKAKTKIVQIEQMEFSFLLITLTLLLGEALLIFLPMAKTMRKQLQKLLDSQNELNAIFDTVGDALVTLDSDHRVTTANTQSEKILGGTKNELLGKSLDSLITNSEEHLSMTGPHMLGKFMESETTQANGEKMPVEVVVTKTNLSDRVLYTVSLRDISDRKNAEKKVSEFYSTVAHELRSPLTSIHGSLQILKNGLTGQLSDRAKKLVAIGVEETERLTRLIDEFLDLKKIASGNFELRKSDHLIYEIADSAVSGLAGMAAWAGVNISLSGQSEIRVDCDRDRVIQIFTNLISNAIKFSPGGSTIEVNISPAQSSRTVRASVTNLGPEISLVDIPKLFTMFQQTSSAQLTSKKGTGLGLAISKALVEQHQGHIGVTSDQANGTTFWFEI
jgi:PAS domain S-box-containing protein